MDKQKCEQFKTGKECGGFKHLTGYVTAQHSNQLQKLQKPV